VGIQMNGMWCEDPISVKRQVKQYFESKFEAVSEFKLNLDGVSFRTISEADNNLLCTNISEVEVLEVVRQCDSSKCPGPNGFNFFFVKKNWEVIGKDIVRAILSF